MSSLTINTNPIIDAVHGRTVPVAVKNGAIGAMVLGVVAFAVGLSMNPIWTWGAFLVAILYTLALAQGGIVFAVMMTLTWGRWGRPLKRIGEAFGFFLPVGYLMLLVFLLAGNSIYPWHEGTIIFDEPISLAPHSEGAWATKEMWLSLPFFIARQAAMFAVLIVLDYFYLKASLRPDFIMAKARLGDKAPAWWDHFTGGASSLKDEVADSEHKQGVIAVLIAISFPMIFSFAAFDLIMSLSPWWYSNMFGGWFFMSSFWVALCGIGIYALLTRDWLGIREHIKPSTMHDLGKLSLAFCMFWGYTTFAQILPIWYASMPEETDFLLVRMTLPAWSTLTHTVAVTCFISPFIILTSRGIKKMKWPFIAVLSVILVGIFLERTMLVMPSIYLEETFPVVLFAVVSVGLLIGALGAFTFVVNLVMSQVPAIPVSDPKIHPHPWDIHAQSLDAAPH